MVYLALAVIFLAVACGIFNVRIFRLEKRIQGLYDRTARMNDLVHNIELNVDILQCVLTSRSVQTESGAEVSDEDVEICVRGLKQIEEDIARFTGRSKFDFDF